MLQLLILDASSGGENIICADIANYWGNVFVMEYKYLGSLGYRYAI